MHILSKGDKELERMEKKIKDISKDPELVSYIDYDKLAKIAHEMDIEEAHESGYSEGVLETAKNLLQKKIDSNIISETTGLSKEEIEELS